MPGNVRNATPIDSLAFTLSTKFEREQGLPVRVSSYRNGESQRAAQADTPRRRWRLGKRLAPAELAALRAFYEARGGPLHAFYFFDPYETAPPFSLAPQTDDGKYVVHFEGSFEQRSGIARADVDLVLAQAI